jgi:hypothetical protein
MKQLCFSLTALALLLGCGTGQGPLGATDDGAHLEQSEDAARITAEAVALDSGGLLESLEQVLGVEDGAAGAQPAGKDRESDEAQFDSTTCTWTITHSREADHGEAGFSRSQTRTLHFMDEEGGCLVQRDDPNLRGLDFTRDYTGESWSPRHESSQAGQGAWTLRGIHDETPGTLVNGSHQEEGESLRHRRRPNGEIVDLSYSYSLSLTGSDLVIILRNGRRVPVAGTLHGVFDAVRNGEEIHREFTIVFGPRGASLDLGEGEAYGLDPVSGELTF